MKPYIVAALSGFLGVAVGAAVFSPSPATASADRPMRVRHIIAERLDIVEPDGTLRQALYSKARDPGIVVKGKEYRHPSRPQSGMLFYNDEGTEVGGLIFAGQTLPDGSQSSGGSLTFDAYEQDQIVQLLGMKEGGRQVSGLLVSDRPAAPLDFAAIDRLARETDPARRGVLSEQLAKESGPVRGFFGRSSNGDSTVVLRDGAGKARLRLVVTSAGEARMEFLDSMGKVSRTIRADEAR